MSQPNTALQNTLQQWSKSPISLIYDIAMLAIIIMSLILFASDSFMTSQLGHTALQHLGMEKLWYNYQTTGHHRVTFIEEVLIGVFIVELIIRWGIAILGKYYYRWFFFPFVHWYEVLSIFPALRALRLIRMVNILYRLNQLGYKIIPQSWIKIGKFYYNMILEEISDRIIINVIDGVERELKETDGQKQMIYHLIERHRTLIGFAVADTLEKTIKPIILKNQEQINQHIRTAVQQAVWETTEVKGLIRQLPFVSKKIESTVENMTGALTENITRNLLKPLTDAPIDGQITNPLYSYIGGEISELALTSDAVESLVESVVFESLEAIKQQVSMQQWRFKLLDEKQKNAT